MSESNAYYEEAQHWMRDERLKDRRRARAMVLLAASAVGVAGLMAAVLVVAMPLKRTEPYVVRVDASSGVVDIVPRYVGQVDLPEAVLRHLLAEYVMRRERYIAALAEADYEETGAFHTASMNEAWFHQWARSNPESPLNRYADGSRVTVQIRSIAFLKRDEGVDIAQVRFRRAILSAPGAQERIDDWVATISSAFSRPSDDLKLRTANPLGFKVVEYRREPEVGEAGPNDGHGGVL
jgi:type IV secretion system protein VirB8